MTVHKNMAIAQPQTSSRLSNPDHSALHRIIAADTSADAKAVAVDSSNNIMIGDGGSTNYLNIAADGEVNLYGTARVVNSIWIGANAVRAPGIKPAEFVDHGISGAWQFTDGTDDTIVATMRIPSRMDRTVAPTISIGWSSTVTEKVGKWQLEYLWTAPGEDTSAVAQATVTLTDTTPATAEGMIISTFPTLVAPSLTDICLHIRIKRLGGDSDDTLEADAELHGMCMNFTSNKLGTAT